jgi:copper homeostasis protein
LGERAVEICVTDLASARAAGRGGADRVELCADLASGGVTPSVGLIQQVVRDCGVPVHVLIRPRPGDFVYKPREFEVMMLDIEAAKQAGAAGVVLGVLLTDRTIDAQSMFNAQLHAGSLPITFHRAFDLAPDRFAAIEALAFLRIDRVLTSGGPGPARENQENLRAIVERAAGRFKVMVGGGIVAADLPALLEETGVQEVHLGSGVTGPPGIDGPFGQAPSVVEVEKVRQIVRLVKG